MKPPGRKRRQVKAKPAEATVEAGEEDEESDSEEESPPRADSGPPHTRYNNYMLAEFCLLGVGDTERGCASSCIKHDTWGILEHKLANMH